MYCVVIIKVLLHQRLTTAVGLFYCSYMNIKLKLAIQKTGRLNDDSLRMLNECGIDIINGGNKLKTEALNFPLEVFFLRDDDIPQYVEDAVADIGFVGENVVYEKKKKVEIVDQLGFGRCRLSIAIKKTDNYTPGYLQGKKIATSYPVIVSEYLKENSINAEVHEISGSVEIAPDIGLADAICDLVSSGSTLFTNGLKEAEPILNSQAVLIQNTSLKKQKKLLLQKLLFRIKSVKRAKNNKYILLNAPNDKLADIIRLLPGMKSPTVLPLADEHWSSVHSVVNENDFWEIIEQLKLAGAEGILIVPIEKMIV